MNTLRVCLFRQVRKNHPVDLVHCTALGAERRHHKEGANLEVVVCTHIQIDKKVV